MGAGASIPENVTRDEAQKLAAEAGDAFSFTDAEFDARSRLNSQGEAVIARADVQEWAAAHMQRAAHASKFASWANNVISTAADKERKRSMSK